jgi:hypothetical protein
MQVCKHWYSLFRDKTLISLLVNQLQSSELCIRSTMTCESLQSPLLNLMSNIKYVCDLPSVKSKMEHDFKTLFLSHIKKLRLSSSGFYFYDCLEINYSFVTETLYSLFAHVSSTLLELHIAGEPTVDHLVYDREIVFDHIHLLVKLKSLSITPPLKLHNFAKLLLFEGFEEFKIV